MNRATISHDTPAPAPDSWPLRRAELIAVLVLCLVAAGLRFAFPSRMAVEHFDEGVYASNLWCPDDGYRYPDRHLYAPSLMPALIEWSIIALGPEGWRPMLPSLVFGTLTIPLLWWVGRTWFHPAVGLAAATLAALSDYHIAFSRSALTDVTLGFWLLLAVYLFERAFQSLSVPRAVAAGVVTGLAWWTKYNGWLPLAISLSGLVAWTVFAPRDVRRLGRRLVLWLIAAAAALLVWSPYWWSLPHGYGEVAANHRNYVLGWGFWIPSIVRHWQTFVHLDGRLTCLSVGASFVFYSAYFNPRRPVTCGKAVRVGAFFGIVLGIWVLVVIGMLFVKLVGSLWLFATIMELFVLFVFAKTVSRWFRSWRGMPPHCESDLRLHSIISNELAIWFLMAWLVGLLVATPQYRPYPRLVLPWMVAVWLVSPLMVTWINLKYARKRPIGSPVAAPVSEVKDTPEPQPNRPSPPMRLCRSLPLLGGLIAILVVVHAGLVFLTLWVWYERGAPAWRPRTDVAQIASAVQAAARREVTKTKSRDIGGRRCVLYIFAEPGLFFHLPADDLAVGPVGNLEFLSPTAKPLGLPTFLVTGPHADRMTDFHDEFAKYSDRLELVQSWPYAASDFVLLDQVPPAGLAAERAKLQVRLFRVK